jgi:hypothetical protein
MVRLIACGLVGGLMTLGAWHAALNLYYVYEYEVDEVDQRNIHATITLAGLGSLLGMMVGAALMQ